MTKVDIPFIKSETEQSVQCDMYALVLGSFDKRGFDHSREFYFGRLQECPSFRLVYQRARHRRPAQITKKFGGDPALWVDTTAPETRSQEFGGDPVS